VSGCRSCVLARWQSGCVTAAPSPANTVRRSGSTTLWSEAKLSGGAAPLASAALPTTSLPGSVLHICQHLYDRQYDIIQSQHPVHSAVSHLAARCSMSILVLSLNIKACNFGRGSCSLWDMQALVYLNTTAKLSSERFDAFTRCH
jgi:hypothetical protein